ncbi:hypothetical protein D3C80_1664740 [compost metagenome]
MKVMLWGKARSNCRWSSSATASGGIRTGPSGQMWPEGWPKADFTRSALTSRGSLRAGWRGQGWLGSLKQQGVLRLQQRLGLAGLQGLLEAAELPELPELQVLAGLLKFPGVLRVPGLLSLQILLSGWRQSLLH